MCKISFLLPNVVAFSCYTVNIHLEKWLMRGDTKRAIWWDLYKKKKNLYFPSNIWVPSFPRCTLTNDSWLYFDFDCVMQLTKSYHIATNVYSRKSAATFGDLPDCFFYCKGGSQWNPEKRGVVQSFCVSLYFCCPLISAVSSISFAVVSLPLVIHTFASVPVTQT